MVANTNQEQLRRLLRLSEQAVELTLEGKRAPLQIAHLLQELQCLKENKPVVDIPFLLASWEEFYRKVYRIKTDFSSLRIPEHQKGFDRLIIVAPGMTPQRLYNKCKEMFPCRKRTKQNLDKIVLSDRTAQDNAYAVWLCDCGEANMSISKGTIGITIEERLLYEQVYFRETGEHLDANSVTLCLGSRDSGGNVLRVSWDDGGLDVGCYCLGFVSDYLSGRFAVL